jgi:hypothetical protein
VQLTRPYKPSWILVQVSLINVLEIEERMGGEVAVVSGEKKMLYFPKLFLFIGNVAAANCWQSPNASRAGSD